MKQYNCFASRRSHVEGLVICLLIGLGLIGCATRSEPALAGQQQAEADLVVGFQSWNAISFIKPDITGSSSVVTFRQKTFTRAALVKLLNSLKIPRGFVVAVLERQYNPGPKGSAGGMDEIQNFFEGLGFRRVVVQDGVGWNYPGGMAVLRDTDANHAPP